MLLESDPKVERYCERPDYVEGQAGRLIDFWGKERRREQFWLLSDGAPDETDNPKRVIDLPVRAVLREDLLARKVRIENWAAIVPYLTADARHIDTRLQQAVQDRLSKPARLGALDELQELLAVWVWNYNGTPHGGLGG